MGGFTQIRLRDCSESNIKAQNAQLKEYGVSRRYRFYSEADIRFEYDGFVEGIGIFRNDLFPKDKINSYGDFKKYWNPKALGEVFCPYNGTLTLDCYFGRMSKRAMHKLAGYLLCNLSKIKTVEGSFSTFVERCGYGRKHQAELMELDK